MKQSLLIIFIIFFAFRSLGEDNFDNSWSKKSCNEIYDAIAIFAALADKEWHNDEEKAARYILASANYATIYKTVCNQK